MSFDHCIDSVADTAAVMFGNNNSDVETFADCFVRSEFEMVLRNCCKTLRYRHFEINNGDNFS